MDFEPSLTGGIACSRSATPFVRTSDAPENRTKAALSGSPRYALYYAPPRESALWQFGCSLLGHDAESGHMSSPRLEGVDAQLWQELVCKPRHYGFHGTLKAPFRLAPGQNAAMLETALVTFADSCPAFELPALELRALGHFFALVPQVSAPDLGRLAHRAVLELDSFRDELTDADRARRNPERLSPRQRVLMEAHGYPFVLEEFRFHMTLTGPVTSPAVRENVAQALTASYARSRASAPLLVRDVALFMQPNGQERFRLVRRFPLSAPTAGRAAP